MIAPEKVSLSDFVSRRLHPTKVTLAYLRHELAHHQGNGTVSVNSAELASVIATVELFIEDYEKLVTREPRSTAAPMPQVERTFVSDARS